jgi:ABC-type Fe3+/spermidine/putrescine transport system ATPase subunit
MGSSSALECRGLTLSYNTTEVLRGLDLEVAAGETVAVLGPSGSGKTSLLAAIAGFVPLSAGSVLIDGGVVAGEGADQPPERRSVSMVFQNYALWPHMTAAEIVAYPLERAGVERSPASAEARRLLDRVGIGELAGRYPSELSGGQQQRVGLARALAKAPVVYLFDEPTAHLDAALRAVLQEELIDRQRETGAAALYATHDPEEALAVADRVALMRDGRIAQIGSARQVYECPDDAWAARLTGPAGLLAVDVRERHGEVITLRLGDDDIAVAGGGRPGIGPAAAVVRPEWAALGGRLRGEVRRVRYAGSRTLVLVDSGAGRVFIESPRDINVSPGDEVSWSLQQVWLVDG